ncbi:MAG: hypothetical protein ABIY71_01795 [Flavobacteriales bacterium]
MDNPSRLNKAEREQVDMILSMWAAIEHQIEHFGDADRELYTRKLAFQGFPKGSKQEAYAEKVSCNDYTQFEGRVSNGPLDALKRNIALREAYNGVLEEFEQPRFTKEQFATLIDAYKKNG